MNDTCNPSAYVYLLDNGTDLTLLERYQLPTHLSQALLKQQFIIHFMTQGIDGDYIC